LREPRSLIGPAPARPTMGPYSRRMPATSAYPYVFAPPRLCPQLCALSIDTSFASSCPLRPSGRGLLHHAPQSSGEEQSCSFLRRRLSGRHHSARLLPAGNMHVAPRKGHTGPCRRARFVLAAAKKHTFFTVSEAGTRRMVLTASEAGMRRMVLTASEAGMRRVIWCSRPAIRYLRPPSQEHLGGKGLVTANSSWGL
jgi:hypothetical protein